MSVDIRKELPEIFNDFAEARQNAFLGIKEIKDQGIPVIGEFCTFFPREIATAVGIYVAGLCQESDETIPVAEKDLPKNLCPLIKASYGFAITDKCPFFYFSDLVVGETTCDGKKKMYEMMGQFKNVHVMELPNSRSEDGRKMWKNEIIKLKDLIEEQFNVEVTDEKLDKAIEIENAVRSATRDFYEMMKADELPMTGLELWHVISSVQYTLNREQVIENLKEAKAAVEAEPKNITGRPRILITGCPIGKATEKVIEAVEDNGGIVVYYENCGGAREKEEDVDPNNPDRYQALADKYLNIGCACMSPNEPRMDLITQKVEEYKVDAVLDMHLQACQPFQVESFNVKKLCQEKLDIPYMAIETDYSDSDKGQLGTRIAAFVEML